MIIYQVCYAINVLIAILMQQTHDDHTNLRIHQDQWNDHTALHHKFDANLNQTKNIQYKHFELNIK